MQESIIKKKKLLSRKLVLLTSPQTFKTMANVSLSNVLEEHPDPKYFLSEKATQSILNRMEKGTTLHTPSKTQTSTEEAT